MDEVDLVDRVDRVDLIDATGVADAKRVTVADAPNYSTPSTAPPLNATPTVRFARR